MANLGGILDTDDLINHVVKMLKNRLACDGVCNGVFVSHCVP